MPTRFRPAVLDQLARHGVRPRPDTTPDRIREFLNELYRYELRRLRDRLLRKEVVRRDYAALVIAIRRRYPLLSIPVEHWTEPA